MEEKLYVYTKRRARVDGKSQYVELIPKLFSNIYMGEIKKINIDKLNTKYNAINKLDLLTKLLNDPKNELNKSKYISTNDKQKIVQMNFRTI